MKMKLSVIGTGYLGATHAACMSSLGFEVIGVDTDAAKIAQLSKGELPFYEPGLDTLLAEEVKSGRLTFTTDFSLVADADMHFVCVGTPQRIVPAWRSLKKGCAQQSYIGTTSVGV